MHKVLVIDDNDTMHELFRCYAMVGDVNLSHAVNLDEAIENIQSSKLDLILLDNRLQPFDDFTQTVPEIYKAGFEGKIAVISSETDAPVYKKVKDYGVSAVINKFDFKLDNFSEMVVKLV